MTSSPSERIAIGKHPCPECGGDLEWNASKQALVCPYCGTVAPWSPAEAGDLGDLIVEHDLLTALNDPIADKQWDAQKVEVKCQISDGQIRDAIRKWYGTRWFAPNKLKRAALTDTLHGIYLPYWTFDAHVDAQWTADAGHYYYVTETYTQNGQRRTRQVRKVRWVPASGRLAHFFDDELVPATTGVHAALLRQVEPFPTTTDLKPYSPEFVRGWTVERYQVDLRRAADLNMTSMEGQTRSLCSAQVPGDTQRNLQVSSRYQGRTFKHILVPVWLVSYTYGSRNFQILANGHTGKIAGERPWSWVKILFAVMAALIILLIFGYFANSQ